MHLDIFFPTKYILSVECIYSYKIKMPKTNKKKKLTYKEMMAEILKPKKVAPSIQAKTQGLGGGVPEKVVKI